MIDGGIGQLIFQKNLAKFNLDIFLIAVSRAKRELLAMKNLFTLVMVKLNQLN